MENSAYVPNPSHLNSPALVVFSQAAGGLQDALRIQRPFNPQFQMSDATKDLHRPFSASSFGLRHMEAAYGGLPAHILSHLHQHPHQFLHPGLTLGGSGAFRPLVTDHLKAAFPSPSAFAPPPKCLKIETSLSGGDASGSTGGGGIVSTAGGSSGSSNSAGGSANVGAGIFSPNDDRYLGPSPRTTDSCSPASASLSPQPTGHLAAVKEESLDAHMSSEDGDHQSHVSLTDNDSPGIHEDNRSFRLGPLFGGGFAGGGYSFNVTGMPPTAAHSINKNSFLFDHVNKKKRDPSSCPVCGLAIPSVDLETHFIHELERLYKLNGTGVIAGRKRRPEPGRPPALPGDSGPEGRWETFLRIKTNRQGRLRIKIRKRKGDDCPICVGRIHRTQEELNMHNEHCPRNKSMMTDEDETVDVEGDSEFEDWAEGQRRRALLSQGRPITSSTGRLIMLGTGGTTTTTTTTSLLHPVDCDTETDDVIVDGDDPEDTAPVVTVTTFPPSGTSQFDTTASSSKDPKTDENTAAAASSTGGVVQSQVATVNSSGDIDVVKVEGSGSGGGGGGGQHHRGGSQQPCDSNVSTSDAEPSSRSQLIEELRSRIRQLEAEGAAAGGGGGGGGVGGGGLGMGSNGGNGGAVGDSAMVTGTTAVGDAEDYKCLICLEHYKKPVISTVCWHVHCEDCWLHTLGNKKVCPQCSMITTPTDLRRIFM